MYVEILKRTFFLAVFGLIPIFSRTVTVSLVRYHKPKYFEASRLLDNVASG